MPKICALIMIQGAIISTASMATVNVMEGKAVFKGFHERNLALSMASAGMTAGLNASTLMSEFSATLNMGEHARDAFTSTFVNTGANTIIGGQDLGDAFLQSGVSAAGSYGMAKLSNAIGISYKKEEFGYVIHKGLHGLAGAAVGAATYAVLDRDIAKGAASGAVGAITAEVIGESYLGSFEGKAMSTDAMAEVTRTGVCLSSMGAALAADAMGFDAKLAADLGGIAVKENSFKMLMGAISLASTVGSVTDVIEVAQEDGPVMAVVYGGVIYFVAKVSATGAEQVFKGLKYLGKAASKLSKGAKVVESKGVKISLTHNAGDPVSFDRKARALQDLASRGKLTKVSKASRDPNVTVQYRENLKNAADRKYGIGSERATKVKDLLKKLDADHLHELQLGGIDHPSFLTMLDRGVNRSVGSQIRHQLANLPDGTKILEVLIKGGQ